MRRVKERRRCGSVRSSRYADDTAARPGYRRHIQSRIRPGNSTPAWLKDVDRRSGSERTLPAFDDPGRSLGGRAQPVGVTVFGCAPDEAAAFRELAPRFGIALTITEAPPTEATARLAAGGRCVSVSHKTRVPNAVLAALAGAGVRYLSTRSAGTDHIDVDVAAGLGIEVAGVSYSPDSVADHTLMLILMALRNARAQVIRTEAQDFRLGERRGRELRDLTVGVIGTGRIGTAVIRRLGGFGCRVLACDRAAAADHIGLDELLECSDVVTLHAPLTAETEHLLDRGRLARLRPDAIVVNTGRGPLIDTAALVTALESGRLGGAALDVVEGEEGIFYTDRRDQPIDDELLLRLRRLPQVLITPHSAFYTDHALRDIVENTLLDCRAHARSHACLG